MINSPFPILPPTRLGAHIVPGIWRFLLPEDVFYYRVDPEVGSSCFSCPQVKEHGFHPSIRCCAFLPRVPNFLLGMALHDPATEAMVRQFVADGFVIPEGSQAAPQQMMLSLQQIAFYPATPKLVCQFLDQESKQCRLYAYRNGVCSTFFCKHDGGEVGAIFWESLQDLLSQIETALAQWALTEAGFDLDAYFRRFNLLKLDTCDQMGGPAWSIEARAILYDSFFGREVELLKRCAEVVMSQKEDLFAIACRQKLKQTEAYDTALRAKACEQHAPALVAESLPEGEPVSVDSIWYSVKLAYRNLQLSKHPS